MTRKITTVGGIERHPTLQSGLLDTDDRLSACPFCGTVAGFREQQQMLRAECSNTSCGVATPYHYRTRELAIEAWNRRKEGSSARKIDKVLLYPITFLEWNLREGVDQIQPNDIASYSYPEGSRERYTDAGWEKAMRRGFAVSEFYVEVDPALAHHAAGCVRRYGAIGDSDCGCRR